MLDSLYLLVINLERSRECESIESILKIVVILGSVTINGVSLTG